MLKNDFKQNKVGFIEEKSEGYLHAAFYYVDRNNCGMGSSAANDTAQAAQSIKFGATVCAAVAYIVSH